MVLDETIRYVKNRQIFGASISHLQSVRHKIAEMATQLEMAQRFVYSVCERYRDGSVEAKEICMMKLYIPDMLHRVVEDCLQLFGGSGFLEENGLSRVYRGMRFFSVGGGPSESMKDLVASYLRV
jgi:acyl-CoA dehydrogenase